MLNLTKFVLNLTKFILPLDSTEMEFNMSRGCFNYLRFTGQSKSCPNALAARKRWLP